MLFLCVPSIVVLLTLIEVARAVVAHGAAAASSSGALSGGPELCDLFAKIVSFDEDDAMGVPLGTSGETAPSGLKVSSGADAALSSAEAQSVGIPDNTLPEWCRFTPRDVDETKCLARTWAHGLGGQCGNKRAEGSLFCSNHAGQENGKGWHGSVLGAIPEAKLREFQKRARVASL